MRAVLQSYPCPDPPRPSPSPLTRSFKSGWALGAGSLGSPLIHRLHMFALCLGAPGFLRRHMRASLPKPMLRKVTGGLKLLCVLNWDEQNKRLRPSTIQSLKSSSNHLTKDRRRCTESILSPFSDRFLWKR
jgi:hypothetical protein